MKKIILPFLFLSLSLLTGCFSSGKLSINLNKDIKALPTETALSVSNVQIVNNQIVISGTGLSDVNAVKITGASFNESFTIETKAATQIIANSLNAVTFDVSKVFSLILSNANASATFGIDFSMCNATLLGHAINCLVTANDKDVLSYDSVSGKWAPRSVELWSKGAGANIYYDAGRVGLGMSTAPVTALDVNGAIKSIAGSNTGLNINFLSGNLQYTNQDCGAINLYNLKSGATYTLAVQGAAGGTCVFTAYSDLGTTLLTLKPGATSMVQTAAKHALFTFLVMGNFVYVASIDGY